MSRPEEHAKDRKAPDPRRFEASRLVLFTDAAMNHIIRIGGLGVVIAVIGIFVFIVSQVIPLFQNAKVGVDERLGAALPPGDYITVAADEWSERPIALRGDGRLFVVDLAGGEGVSELSLNFLGEDSITASSSVPGGGVIAVGTAAGKVHLLDYDYKAAFSDGKRSVKESVSKGYSGDYGGAVRSVAFGQSGSARLVAAVVEGEGGSKLLAKLVERKRSLVGAGDWRETATVDLSEGLRPGVAVESLHVSNRADSLLVVFANGEVDYHFRTGGAASFERRQTFRPFKELDDPRIASAGFLFGDVSLVLVSTTGANRVFSLYRTDEEPVRVFHETKEFPPLPRSGETPVGYANSLRNKAFLLASGRRASLRHATTEKVRWEGELPFEIAHVLVGAKYDSLLLLGADRRFRRLSLEDPHPEIGLRALFGKVWYEGSPEPKYEWQSTGGSDDFEPKLSLVPIIFGTLKGTLYAMLFAVPIALFGALYTSEFLHPRHKVFVKPVMEIMASLPSVVLGFLAALWLAPILERRVPSILCIAVLLPSAAFLVGALWSRQPQSMRKHVPPGREFLYFAPVLLLILAAGWHLGPLVENLFFSVDDGAGNRIGDFTRWWPQFSGTSYELRNSLVVGFVMGFAVIPIVFTIAEDSLSNVPGALRSGSLALGASRWQTAWRVVVPTASAGIFSALMIGLGRAVGETMIVVMATGNTPIMEWNIFSGMRTLAANIAVELPEAPHHGTLYRTLFLGAVALFVMTFAVNTVAEILRQHLRERYKTV